MQPSLLAVVLAGGQSRRMGQDKSRMYSPKWQKTLIQQSLEILKPLGCQCLISGGHHPAALNDLIPERGPLSGIHAAIDYARSHTECTELLVVPVDMPDLSVASLINLLHYGRQQQTMAAYENSVLPLYMPITHGSFVKVSEQLRGEDNWSLHCLMERHQGKRLTVQDSRVLTNINCPADWQEHCV